MRVGSALVTGASRGIGLGIAEMLARRNYGLTLVARDSQRLEHIAARLGELGARQVVTVAADLAGEGAADRIAEAHNHAFATLDVLVLNAGVGSVGEIGQYPMRRFDKTIAVNLRSPFELLQATLPHLTEAARSNGGSGARVVALSSITGVYAEPGLAAYGATKAALLSLVTTLNAEKSDQGIVGTVISPGYVETDMTEWIQDRIPGERMIPVSDVVRLVEMVIDLSPRSVVPQILVSRAGTSGYTA